MNKNRQTLCKFQRTHADTVSRYLPKVPLHDLVLCLTPPSQLLEQELNCPHELHFLLLPGLLVVVVEVVVVATHRWSKEHCSVSSLSPGQVLTVSQIL